MPKKQKLNDPAFRGKPDSALAKMRKRVAVQAAMAATAVGLTVVMLFAMTVAWYTNIVHTSGLTFQVEPWGFDGIVTSNNPETIIAGPGDDGLINLEVTSFSDSPSAVSVSISKDAMATQLTADGESYGPEMQKRIYFYVDTPMVRNGETMDRVYLNSRESYTYNLFSNGKLTLTETVHNAPLLKWHWVYDMLGYYVEGTLTKLADGTKGMTIHEYLRPIEYDYDAATTKYVAELGTYTIITVDGTTTPDAFLVELSKTDGYEGEIDPAKAVVDDKGDIYYPVSVDEETGKGVYAYLCTYAQVEQGIARDTALAELTTQTTYTAKLLVSAQKSKNSVINVNTLAGLNSAIDLGVADSIQLSSDVNFTESLTITQGQRVMLDLNGKTITVTDPTVVPVVVEEGGSLTMVNGKIEYTGTGNAVAIQSTGAEIVMNNVTLSGFYRGMQVTDNAGDPDPTDEVVPLGLDSTIRLVNCNWTTTDYGVMVYGNGATSEQKTQVVIEGTTLTCGSYGIVGNGNPDSYGTDIQVINSTITSIASNVYSGIYQPQKDSVLTIYNSTVSGYTGIALKAGTLNILGSDISGLGTGIENITSASQSGFADTGDAVYIETNYGHPIQLNVSDLVTVNADGTVTTDQSKLTSTNRYGLRVYVATDSNVEIDLTGGWYSKIHNDEKFNTYFDQETLMLAEKDGGYQIAAKTAG